MVLEDPKGAQRRQTADYRRKHAREIAFSQAIKIDLVDGITSFKQDVSPQALANAIATRQYGKLDQLIPWDKLDAKLAPAGEKLALAGNDAVKAAVKEVGYPSEHRFDLANPRFENFIKNRTGNLITVVQEGTVQAVRDSVTKAYTHGWSPQDVANNIRGSIGLNARQSVALTNYRASLSTPEKGLAPDRVDALASAYESRLLDQRATMIGRTEVRQAQNAGQLDVWQAAHEDGLLPAHQEREWVVDGAPCPEVCTPMSGERVGLYEPWELPDGRHVMNVSDSHPNCFCIESLVL